MIRASCIKLLVISHRLVFVRCRAIRMATGGRGACDHGGTNGRRKVVHLVSASIAHLSLMCVWRPLMLHSYHHRSLFNTSVLSSANRETQLPLLDLIAKSITSILVIFQPKRATLLHRVTATHATDQPPANAGIAPGYVKPTTCSTDRGNANKLNMSFPVHREYTKSDCGRSYVQNVCNGIQALPPRVQANYRVFMEGEKNNDGVEI